MGFCLTQEKYDVRYLPLLCYSFSEKLLENAKSKNPVEQLMSYTYGMFMANKENPRMMQFAMRFPFDAYAVFDPEQWTDGAQKSDMHKKALANIIITGVKQGQIPDINPSAAANSFWSVFRDWEYSMTFGTPVYKMF